MCRTRTGSSNFMQANHSSLGNQAFGDHADTLTIVRYGSHHDALAAMHSALREPKGIGLLSGPEGAGKSTTLREMALQLANDADVAFIDGTTLRPRELLTRMLSQFGFESRPEPDEELLLAVNEFASQQTSSWQPPILIIDNADRMYPSTLGILNSLAGFEIQGRFAMRFILSGDKGLTTLVGSNGMTNVAERNPIAYSFEPLSSKETMIYLHARLQAAGSERADTIFPFDVCDRLREQSGGWPGLLNKYALEAIKRSSEFPISLVNTYSPDEDVQETYDIPVLQNAEAVNRKSPRLVVSKDGDTLLDYEFKDKKVLIGRSDFADIIIDDDFVSKLHVALLLYSDALILLDLNSANGTTVNSVKVGKTILKDDDIISLGNHRCKIENAPAISDEMNELLKSPDTLKMKNLVDMRRLRAKRRIKAAKL